MQKGVRLCIVGSEILNGFIADTNTRFFASEMYSLGFDVKEARTIPDEPEIILATWREFAQSGDLIINSGGLGPTDDDLTVDMLCKYLGVEEEYDRRAERKLRLLFADRPQETLERGLRQVRIPKGTEALKNGVGLAPGIWASEIPMVCLPGFPIEIESIWPQVVAKIKDLSLERTEAVKIPIWGIGESSLFAQLSVPDEVEVGVHALPLGSRVFLKAKDRNLLDEARVKVEKDFAPLIVENPLTAFMEFLAENQKTIGTVESCTGGLAGKLITDEPGSSQVYRGSITTYHNEVKQDVVGVDPDLIAKHGAVSAPVAAAMVRGGLRALAADYVLSATGIAGPSGGTTEKPVGTVFIGLGTADEVWVGTFNYPLGRARFRAAAVYTAFLSLYQRFVYFANAADWQEHGFGQHFFADKN